MSMTYSYVYKLTNKINDKIYIGKTNKPARRLTRHFSIAKTGYSKNNKLQYIYRAIKKYGRENFIFEIIEKCDSENIAYEKEIYWISLHNSNNSKFGYNLNGGGLGGTSPSPEVCVKISKSLSGRINSLGGLLNRLYRVFSLIPNYKDEIYKSAHVQEKDKQRKKIVENYDKITNGILNDDVKRAIFELREMGPFRMCDLAKAFGLEEKTIKYVISRYGKSGILTKEQKKENRSKAMRGRKLSKDHKRKISEANKGTFLSNEAKTIISKKNSGAENGMYGRTHSKEARNKMSDHQRNRTRRPLTTEEKTYLSNKLKGRAKPKPISPKIKQKVIEMYASGNYTKKQLAEELRLKYNTVVGILRKRI